MALSKLHPTEAIALRTPKRLKVFHKSKDKRQVRVSNLVLAALWRASQPTHGHHGPETHSRITLIRHQLFGCRDKGLLLRENFNVCGWLQSVPLITEKQGPLRVRKVCVGGGHSNTTAAFDNDDSKWREGWLGFVKWYYLYGPQWGTNCAHEAQSERLNNGMCPCEFQC